MKKICLICASILLTFNPNCFSNEFEELKALAEQGDPVAQYELYKMYYFGQGVTKDDMLSLEWLLKSVQSGFPVAQCELGRIYCYDGKNQNYNKAIAWLQAAAKQGYARAQYELYKMYYSGKGVSQNYALAFKWLQAAAEQEYAEAQSEFYKMTSENAEYHNAD